MDSVIDQTYENIEIILVNNDPDEKTIEICKKYSLLDNRIKYISTTNVSVGGARNIGLDNACGEYIGFVDSDDYIEKDMYEILLKNLIQNYADVSMVSFCYEVDGKIIPRNFNNKIEVLDKNEALKEVLKDRKIHSFVWNKLFKKELWDKNRFTEDRVFEDIDVVYRIFQNIDKLVYIDSLKYTYVQRNDSIMHERKSQYSLDRLNVAVERYNMLKETSDEELKFINSYALAVNMIVIYRSIALYDYNDIYNEFMKYYDLFMKIINKYEERIRKILTPNQNIVLNFMMEDIENAQYKIKEIKDIDK